MEVLADEITKASQLRVGRTFANRFQPSSWMKREAPSLDLSSFDIVLQRIVENPLLIGHVAW